MPLAQMLMRKVSERCGNLTGHCQYEQTTKAYTIYGVGVDIWDKYDDFHFAYKKLKGDGAITTRIESIKNVHEWSKVGVMIRSTLEPNCPNAMVLLTPSGKLSFQYRRQEAGVTNGLYTSSNSIQLPHWVRLSRRGNHFTAQHSEDGVTWQDILDTADQPATIEIAMDETVFIGLAVTSHDITQTAEARFSHVSKTGNVRPTGPFNESCDIPSRLSSH